MPTKKDEQKAKIHVRSTPQNVPNELNIRQRWFNELGEQLAKQPLGPHYDNYVLSRQAITRVISSVNDGLSAIALNTAVQQAFSYTATGTSWTPRKDSKITIAYSESSFILSSSQENLEPLEDLYNTASSLEHLLSLYGSVSHMGITDPSFKVFMTEEKDAALCFKIKNNVAVICGDPLCHPSLFSSTLCQFRRRYKSVAEHVAFLGASEKFKQFAQQNGWVTMKFGIERNIDPVSNSLFAGTGGKRIYSQSRLLLNSEKGGLQLSIYSPSIKRNISLESEMMEVFHNWRLARENSRDVQSFLTVLDISSCPGEMLYLYARDSNGVLQGFAGLRRLGANRGYHLDPYIEAPSAPRGTSELLVIASMAVMKSQGVRCLSLGFEPSSEMNEITGMPRYLTRMIQSLHGQIFQRLPINGKRSFHNKFRPDDSQDANLYLVFQTKRIPRPRQLVALAGIVNINIQDLLVKNFMHQKKSAAIKVE